MNLIKTIENIVKNADSYIDPDLVATIVYDNYTLGTNDFDNINDYEILNEDSYSQKILKVLKNENVFITLGMLTFAPIVNECDIYSTEDFTLQLSDEEFEKYGHLKDKYFGVMFVKNSEDFIYGVCDLCGCKVDACFSKLEQTDDKLIKKIKEIMSEKII